MRHVFNKFYEPIIQKGVLAMYEVQLDKGATGHRITVNKGNGSLNPTLHTFWLPCSPMNHCPFCVEAAQPEICAHRRYFSQCVICKG